MKQVSLYLFLGIFPLLAHSQTLRATAISCEGTVYEIYSDGTWKKGQGMEVVNKNVYYGGSASVRVKSGEKERVLQASTNCTHSTKSDAKADLKYRLENGRYSSESYVTEIKYDIDVCPK